MPLITFSEKNNPTHHLKSKMTYHTYHTSIKKRGKGTTRGEVSFLYLLSLSINKDNSCPISIPKYKLTRKDIHIQYSGLKVHTAQHSRLQNMKSSMLTTKWPMFRQMKLLRKNCSLKVLNNFIHNSSLS